MKALLVYRAPQFSPNSVEKDKAILEETGRNLLLQGIDVQYVDEERLMDCLNMDMILTMGRLPQTQERLAEAEEMGIPLNLIKYDQAFPFLQLYPINILEHHKERVQIIIELHKITFYIL